MVSPLKQRMVLQNPTLLVSRDYFYLATFERYAGFVLKAVNNCYVLNLNSLFQIVFLNNAKILIMFMQLLQHQLWKALWKVSTVSLVYPLLLYQGILPHTRRFNRFFTHLSKMN